MSRSFGSAELAQRQDAAARALSVLEPADTGGKFQRAVEWSVEAIAYAIDVRDSYTSRHSDEVVELATAVGKRLGLDDKALTELQISARLHDVGKIAIPDSILHKPSPLDPAEWSVMRQHPVIGAELLEGVSGLEGVAEVVRAEHEHWDGTGYPNGLCADQIPLKSRIVFVCDAYHAMTSDRPYRGRLRSSTAVSELRSCSGKQFDPDVVEALIRELRERSISTRFSAESTNGSGERAG